jgi:hypothetical protein
VATIAGVAPPRLPAGVVAASRAIRRFGMESLQ